MKEIATIKDLMVLHLLSLYDAEMQWSAVMKESAGTIASRELKDTFGASSKMAEENAEELKDILAQLGKSTLSKKNAIVKDLSGEMNFLRNNAADQEVLDAGMIVTHQCMNHYLIAKYGTVASFARLLQQDHIANALHEIMEKEKAEDETLSRLAEEKINAKAKGALVM